MSSVSYLWTLFYSLLVAACIFESNAEDIERPYLQSKTTKIKVNPEVQHIAIDPELAHLRPPPARIPERPTIFIGVSSFRDAQRCGKTLFVAFNRSSVPENVYIGVLDQVFPEIDGECLEEYCKLSSAMYGECRYKDQIKIDLRSPKESKGPMYARSLQQQLVGDQEFCMNIDSHSLFINQWDTKILEDWKSINNEMGILTTYPHHAGEPAYDDETGEALPADQKMHLCRTFRRTHGFIRNGDATLATGNTIPLMTALYGAGLVFGKCHAEKRVLIDPYQKWIFDGEEFMRSSHLFSYGYDLYTPSALGMVVYHNYTKVPYRFEYTEIDPAVKEKEKEIGINRHKLVLGIPFVGKVDTNEWEKYGYGSVRSLESYGRFSGAAYDQLTNETDHDTCHQLHWVPYENATEIELLLPGWKMSDALQNVTRGIKKFNIRMERQKPVEVDVLDDDNIPEIREPSLDSRTLLKILIFGGSLCGIIFKFYGKYNTISPKKLPRASKMHRDL